MRVGLAIGTALTAALALSSCASNEPASSSSASGGSSSSASASTVSGTLNAQGSSAQTNAQTAWTKGFQTANSGDPIVQYDKIANRWVLTQFAVNSTPFLQCVAVSTTSDATGTYNRYAFSFGNQFNDYPKMAVWPDAYYATFNMFNISTESFLGSDACAYDGAAMRSGRAKSASAWRRQAPARSIS